MSAFLLIRFIIFIFILFYNVRSLQHQSTNNNSLPLASIFDRDTILRINYANCFLIDNDNMIYYDFTNLKYLSNSEKLTQENDGDYKIQTNEMNLYFNFCKNTNFKCNDTDSLITVKYKDDTCMSFTKPNYILKEWIYKGENSQVLDIKMDSDVTCTDYRNYSVYYKFICDSQGERKTINV